MSGIKWKDVSSFSQDDKVRTPKTWECNPHPWLCISVTRGHIHYKGHWVMHCHPWFECHEIFVPVDDIATAQQMALDIVRRHVAELSAALAPSDDS